MRRLGLGLTVLALLAGCGGGDGDESPDRRLTGDRLIRGWSASLNAGDYEGAASFFAPGAVVEQDREFRLPGREAAVRFNRGLPCRADIADIKDEDETWLATFDLRDGPGGPCSGLVRVRIKIRDQKFVEWRQLMGAPPPAGDTI